MNDDRPPPLTHAQRQKKLRQAKQGTPVPEGNKHGISTYTVYACRCATCRAAHARRLHRRHNPWIYRDDLHGTWRQRKTDQGHILDVLCWPPIGADPDWTCPCEERRTA